MPSARSRVQPSAAIPNFTTGSNPMLPTTLPRHTAAAALALVASAVPSVALASFLSGEALDTAATVIAWFVLCFVPIVVIVLFWLVHVMPEKIAEKRHHPQKDAIHALCLLSLVFGGLLWPFAWLWAYTKPVGYRLAYGTDKHDDYFVELSDRARAGALLGDELAHLREELDAMAAKGLLPARLKALRAELDALQTEPAGADAKAGSA
jgi:CBS domain containing-hemolysin-like protein